MKKRMFVLFTSLSKEELKSLTYEVKEGIAVCHPAPDHKTFTVAELWDIQRRMKSRVQNKYL